MKPKSAEIIRTEFGVIADVTSPFGRVHAYRKTWLIFCTNAGGRRRSYRRDREIVVMGRLALRFSKPGRGLTLGDLHNDVWSDAVMRGHAFIKS